MNLFRYLSLRNLKCNMSGLPRTMSTEEKFSLQRVLLISKTTRLEMEKQTCSDIVDSDFRSILVERGSAYLVKSHDEHKKFEKEVIQSLEKLNVDVKIVDRYDKPKELLDWADAVISVGGDGTFLMAANNITNPSKPVIGLNSCPATSIGYLCLPKVYSTDVFKTLSDIKKGRFTWAYRQRIKVNLHGKNLNKSWISVHEKTPKRPNAQEADKSVNQHVTSEISFDIPHLSLNEVFIAESSPASVSYLDISVDDSDFVTTKSSGICICTGSGSSSWNFTMNRISREVVQKLFGISGHLNTNIDDVVEKYNNSLRFAADDEQMNYTIRDMIPTPVWPKMPDLKSKSFARKLQIRSQCREGYLVIDGGCAYQFNSGATAILRTDPESVLKTINLCNFSNL